MNQKPIEPDLFLWTPPAASPITISAPKIRRTCPIVISGLSVGITDDLETLVIDGTK